MIVDINKNEEQIKLKSNCEQLHTMVSNSAYKAFSSLSDFKKNISSEFSLFFFYQLEYDERNGRREVNSEISVEEYKNENLFNTLCNFLFEHNEQIEKVSIRDFIEFIFFLKSFPFVPIFTDENGSVESVSDWIVDISYNKMRDNVFRLYDSFVEYENIQGNKDKDKIFESFIKSIREHNKFSENQYAMNDNTLENVFKEKVFNSDIPLNIAVNVSMQKLNKSEPWETALEKDNSYITLCKPHGENYETALEQVLSIFEKEYSFSPEEKINNVFYSFL